jgi:osmotically-inducible protein OsmY
MKDKATAGYVSKIKIIAHAGLITLEGSVPSGEIRHTIEQKATAVVGIDKVTDNIDVKPAAAREKAR